MRVLAKIFPWAKSGPNKKQSKSKIGRSYSHKSAENLNCPICLDEFEKPILVLPCQHSFCRKCIEGVVEFSNGGSEYDDYFDDGNYDDDDEVHRGRLHPYDEVFVRTIPVRTYQMRSSPRFPLFYDANDLHHSYPDQMSVYSANSSDDDDDDDEVYLRRYQTRSIGRYSPRPMMRSSPRFPLFHDANDLQANWNLYTETMASLTLSTERMEFEPVLIRTMKTNWNKLCNSTGRSIDNIRCSFNRFYKRRIERRRVRLWMIHLYERIKEHRNTPLRGCDGHHREESHSLSSEEDMETFLKCPLCRAKVKLGVKGIDGLKRDVSLENMLT